MRWPWVRRTTVVDEADVERAAGALAETEAVDAVIDAVHEDLTRRLRDDDFAQKIAEALHVRRRQT